MTTQTATRILNATPHALDLRVDNGNSVSIPACGTVVRCAEWPQEVGGCYHQQPCCWCQDPDNYHETPCRACGNTGVRTQRIPFFRVEYGAVTGLDALHLRAGDVLIVSALAAQRIVAGLAETCPLLHGEACESELHAVPDGVTVCCPGPAIRDAAGRIIGCDGLAVVART